MSAVSPEPTNSGLASEGWGAGRLAGLDGLRALAAFAVFFHSVGFNSGRTYDGAVGRYLGRLDVGVPIFFLLSGFLLFCPIAASVLDERPLPPAAEYLWRRVMRIYPAFWVALFLIVVFTSEDLGVADGITTSLLIHIHWTEHVVGPIPQAWSPATGVSFYLALPMLARLLRPWLKDRNRPERRNALLIFVAGCYLLSVFFRICVLGLQSRWSGDAVLWLPGMFDYFAIGMGLAVARIEALTYIGDNLDDQPRVAAARLGRLWSVYRPLQMVDFNTGEGRERWASNLALVGFWIAVPVALVGWWRLGRDRVTRWPLAVLALHVSLIGMLFYGIPRFRVPAEIAVVVCSATAIHWLSSLGACPHRPTSSSPRSSS